MADQGYEQTPNHLALVLYQGPRITPLYLQPDLRFLNDRRRPLDPAPRQGLRTRRRPWPPLALLEDVPDRARLRPDALLDRLTRDFMEECQRQQLLSAAVAARAATNAATYQACSGEIDTSSGIVLDCGHGYHKDCLAWSYMLAMIKILENQYETSTRPRLK